MIRQETDSTPPDLGKSRARGPVAVAIASAMTALAWILLLSAHARSPSPPRFAVVTPPIDGAPTPPVISHERPLCYPPSVAARGRIYMACSLRADGHDVPFLARFDLARGEAMRIPTSGEEPIDLRGFASGPEGDVAFVDSKGVMRIRADGRVEDCGSPGVLLRVRGFALVAEGPEVVLGERDPRLHVFRDGRWISRDLPRPEAPPGEEARLAHAFRDGGGWSFVFTLAASQAFADPRNASGGAVPKAEDALPVRATVVIQRDGEPARPIGAAMIEGQSLRSHAAEWIDPSPGNVVMVPFGLHATHAIEGGQLVALPRAPLSGKIVTRHHYLFEDGRLKLQLRERSLDDFKRVVARVGDRWLEIGEAGQGSRRIAPLGVASDPVVRDLSEAAEITLAPAEDGGLWALGAQGDYVRLDGQLRRADALSLLERVRRLYDLAGLASDGRTARRLAVITLPLLLSLFPALVALSLLAGSASRRAREARWKLLYGAAVLCIVLTTLSARWFLQVISQI